MHVNELAPARPGAGLGRHFTAGERDGRVFWPPLGPFSAPGGRARTPPTHIRAKFAPHIGKDLG